MKLQLVNASLSKGLCPSIRAGGYPPLNLVSLSTYILHYLPSIEVEILDGEILEEDNLINRLDADVVGISCNTLTYSSALAIAKEAKYRGAKVILGGTHPTFYGTEILHNQKDIDLVIIGDGEEALRAYLVGSPFHRIPNCLYREGNKPLQTPISKLSLDSLPTPNYSLIDLDPYFNRFRHLYPDKPFSSALAISSSRGCRWRDKTGGCVFCSIQLNSFRISSPSYVWEQILEYQKKYNIDFIWDVSDSFTMQADWVREFARTKPKRCNVNFHIYSRVASIRPEIVDDLKTIGVYEVLLGIESADKTILHNANKGSTPQMNLKALQCLHRSGIQPVISLLLGMPGETIHSAEKTLTFCRDICSWAEINEIHCSIIQPLPGSRIMRDLLKHPNLGSKYNGLDDLPLEQLRRDYIQNFTNCDYDTLLQIQKEIIMLFPRGGAFGQSEEHRLNISSTFNNDRTVELYEKT
jgi:radical SAM superfamily enzyme YgiQ (UPF0313 family)